MTFGQYQLHAEGYQIRESRKWERFRFLASTNYGAQGSDVKPTDLFSLPTDKVDFEDRPEVEPMTSAEVRAWIKKIESIKNWKIYDGISF